MTKGYYLQEQKTEETFRAKILGEEERGCWLRTGDLGFVIGRKIYLSGRYKVFFVFCFFVFFFVFVFVLFCFCFCFFGLVIWGLLLGGRFIFLADFRFFVFFFFFFVFFFFILIILSLFLISS